MSLPQSRAEAGRVLIVSPVGLDGQGGIDRLLAYFVEEVARSGVDLRFDHVGARGPAKGPRWILHFVKALGVGLWLLLTRRYALMHIHVSTDGSALRKIWFGRLARLFGVPYVIHFHGLISDAARAANPPWLRAMGKLARNAHEVIVLGDAFRAPFCDHLHVEPARVRIIYNGVPDIRADAVIPRSNDGHLDLLFCGEIGVRKGLDLLVAALAQLPQASWRLTIAGNGDAEPFLDVLRQAGLAGRVTTHGWLPMAEAHRLARACDIVVLPSRAEALPLSLIEGAAAGAALVATDIGAVSEVVRHGVNGVLVPQDAQALASALGDLAKDHARLADFQAASRVLYEQNFTLPIFAARILETYRRFGVVA